MKDTHKSALLKATGATDLPFISDGIEAGTSGYIISEDGLTRIAEALEIAAVQAAQLLTAQESLSAANEALIELNGQLAAATATAATNNALVAGLQARVSELEEEAPLTQTTREKDKTRMAAVASYKDPNNVFNQIADGLFGVPKEKEAV